MRIFNSFGITLAFALLLTPVAPAWGPRAHSVINQVAVESLPQGDLDFLKPHKGYIVARASIPDSWRGVSEPFLKIVEDPNHGWFREQFGFLPTERIPRSRYEFVLALYKERDRIQAENPGSAQLMNVRWTGTLPYAAVETYERLKTGMRLWRMAKEPQAKHFLELDIAHYIGRLGHYVADGAQPMHVTIHHDGWVGPNPNNYSTDPRIHGKMETAFVNLIELKPADIQGRIGDAKLLDDPFQAMLEALDAARADVEPIYQLDLEGAWEDAAHPQAREMVYRCSANGARLLRDLIYTAWTASGEPSVRGLRGAQNPISPENPAYNPETGSAPAPRSRQ